MQHLTHVVSMSLFHNHEKNCASCTYWYVVNAEFCMHSSLILSLIPRPVGIEASLIPGQPTVVFGLRTTLMCVYTYKIRKWCPMQRTVLY